VNDKINFTIRPLSESDKEWVHEIFLSWGAEFIVSRGRKIYPHMCEGFVAVSDDNERVGLVTYEIIGDQCEIVTLDAFKRWQGIGTALVAKVVETAKTRANIKRVWLITTNSNIEALRFYMKRGFTLAALHVNALESSRKLKPNIPTIGHFGIPMRDEIEFEMFL
jgi:ribosomal protein S18 acetylase RimI-like enzyme